MLACDCPLDSSFVYKNLAKIFNHKLFAKVSAHNVLPTIKLCLIGSVLILGNGNCYY